jgi:hypothetical protein
MQSAQLCCSTSFFAKLWLNPSPEAVSSVSVSTTGHPDHDQLLTLDLVLDHVGDDVARVAALGHDPDLFLAVGQVVGQVDAAVAVPHQTRDLRRGFGDVRLVHHRDRPLAEADHHVHGAGLQQASGDLPDSVGSALHVRRPQPVSW